MVKVEIEFEPYETMGEDVNKQRAEKICQLADILKETGWTITKIWM